MQKYKTIEDKVKVILTSQTDTRDDDMKFYLCVCRYCQPSIGTMPFETVMTQCRSLGIPCAEDKTKAASTKSRVDWNCQSEKALSRTGTGVSAVCQRMRGIYGRRKTH